jgi:hypothetical protein
VTSVDDARQILDADVQQIAPGGVLVAHEWVRPAPAS